VVVTVLENFVSENIIFSHPAECTSEKQVAAAERVVCVCARARTAAATAYLPTYPRWCSPLYECAVVLLWSCFTLLVPRVYTATCKVPHGYDGRVAPFRGTIEIMKKKKREIINKKIKKNFKPEFQCAYIIIFSVLFSPSRVISREKLNRTVRYIIYIRVYDKIMNTFLIRSLEFKNSSVFYMAYEYALLQFSINYTIPLMLIYCFMRFYIDETVRYIYIYCPKDRSGEKDIWMRNLKWLFLADWEESRPLSQVHKSSSLVHGKIENV